jgi:hypothetical protein
MARWGLWAASVIAAAGAGAGLAALRRRRPVAPGLAGPDPAAAEAAELAPPPADVAPPEDPQQALDAARERLRERADALRDQIEREGEEPPAED